MLFLSFLIESFWLFVFLPFQFVFNNFFQAFSFCICLVLDPLFILYLLGSLNNFSLIIFLRDNYFFSNYARFITPDYKDRVWRNKMKNRKDVKKWNKRNKTKKKKVNWIKLLKTCKRKKIICFSFYSIIVFFFLFKYICAEITHRIL